MSKGIWLLVILSFMLLALPAYAYGDPTGGMLFQVLMPALAAIWGLCIIFANGVRNGFAKLVRRLRGPNRDQPVS